MSTKVYETIGRVTHTHTHTHTQVESRNDLGIVDIHQSRINNIIKIKKVSLYQKI